MLKAMDFARHGSIQFHVEIDLSWQDPKAVSGVMTLRRSKARRHEPAVNQVLGQLGQGIQNPGGGEYGQYAMYQWLGGGDYFGFKYKQEDGLAYAGEAIQGFKRNFGHMDPMAQRYLFGKLFRMTMHQAEGVLKSFDQLGGLAGYGDMARPFPHGRAGRARASTSVRSA